MTGVQTCALPILQNHHHQQFHLRTVVKSKFVALLGVDLHSLKMILFPSLATFQVSTIPGVGSFDHCMPAYIQFPQTVLDGVWYKPATPLRQNLSDSRK